MVQAKRVLDEVQRDPQKYAVPEMFMAECFAVLSRFRGATVESVREAMSRLESLGIERVSLGHDLLERAAAFSIGDGLSGYDAIYLALASLTNGIWLTADVRAARRVSDKRLVQVL